MFRCAVCSIAAIACMDIDDDGAIIHYDGSVIPW